MASRYEFTSDGRRPVMPPVHRRQAAPPPSEDPGAEMVGISLVDQIRAFLRAQGLDPDRELERAQTARGVREQRAKDRAAAAGDIAIHLRKAKRALAFEQRGFCDGAAGFSVSKVAEASQRVRELDAALRECCLDDPVLVDEARRRAAR